MSLEEIDTGSHAGAEGGLADALFDHAHEGMMILCDEGRVLRVNPAFSDVTGYAEADVVGRSLDMFAVEQHDVRFHAAIWSVLREEGVWRGGILGRRKSGEAFPLLLTLCAVDTGRSSCYVGTFMDLSVLRTRQRELDHMTHYDALTCLPNRALFVDRLQVAMAQTRRSGRVLVICYLDLDCFKHINDAYGHAAGDRMLIEASVRLLGAVRAGDTVARLGGDEFALLMGDLPNVEECHPTLTRMLASLSEPMTIDGCAVQISASIGATVFPSDDCDPDTLLRHADQAMLIAKQKGRDGYHLFDADYDLRVRKRHADLERIRLALLRKELCLYFQPKVNLRTGRVVGAEALLRWMHPEHGLVLPGEFLPLVENTGLMAPIGEWVLDAAVEYWRRWRAAGLEIGVSVNIAASHLLHGDFLANLTARLGQGGMEPQHLELEILETTALEDLDKTFEVLAACRRLGVSISLDDFGIGYSSLAYLKRLPVNALKIDRSFVRDMLQDADDLAIIEGVIGLAQAFGKEVVAEGVETITHGKRLLRMGCGYAQGFGIARPMPGYALVDWAIGYHDAPLVFDGLE